jgi:hypothetical protein
MRFFDTTEVKLRDLTVFRPLPKALLPADWTSPSTAWLVAIGQANLYLKWRPFHELEESLRDTQVVEIPLSKVLHYKSTSNHITLKLAKDMDSRSLERRLLEESARHPKAKRTAQISSWQYAVCPSGRHGIGFWWNAYPSSEHFLRLLETYGVTPLIPKPRRKPPLTFLLPPWNTES